MHPEADIDRCGIRMGGGEVSLGVGRFDLVMMPPLGQNGGAEPRNGVTTLKCATSPWVTFLTGLPPPEIYRPAGYQLRFCHHSPTSAGDGFFKKSLDGLIVAGRVAWPRTDVRKAELHEQRSDVTLIIINAEALGDDALEVNPQPAHDAVDP
jgi:hypothetical protein